MNRSLTLIDAAPGRSASIFRYSPRDAWLLWAALAEGFVTAATVPLALFGGARGAALAAAILGVSLWWCSNTIAHNHLHRPLFRARLGNAAFSVFLSVLLGVPQTLWRARHLAHHAGLPRGRWPSGSLFILEVALIAGLWACLALLLPRFLLFAYAPGYLLGMALCSLQGRYEHKAEIGAPGSGVSYYGHLYNLLWFNDGYHVEHHRFPGEHWTALPARRLPAQAAAESALPPVLRWSEPLQGFSNWLSASALSLLESLVFLSSALQRFVIDRHERAFRALLPALDPAKPLRRIGIVGGGLFPRTLITLKRLLPDTTFIIVDASAHNLERARRYLKARAISERGVEFILGRFEPGSCPDVDLLVTPLALVGDREALYAGEHGVPILVHDWIWRPRGARSAVVSMLLLKRINLVDPRAIP